MAQGEVPLSTLQSYYQNPGDIYDDGKTESALELLRDYINGNFNYAAGFVSSSVLSKLGWYNVTDYGAEGDGTTDDTTSVQAAIDAAYSNGGAVYFPPGKYLITSSVGVFTHTAKGKAFPSLIGAKSTSVNNAETTDYDQDGSIILYQGTGTAIQFGTVGTTDTGDAFVGGVIRDISIIHSGGDKPTDGSIGLQMTYCVRYRMYNVAIIGFDVGFHNNYGFTADFFGLTSIRNNIGIKLTDNSNSLGFFGIEAHQNNIGVKIMGGKDITINRITVEGQQHGIIVFSDGTTPTVGKLSISNVYEESNTVSVIRIGKDENDTSSPETIEDVKIDNVYHSGSSIDMIQLDECKNINIENCSTGFDEFISIGANVSNVFINGVNETFGNKHLSSRYSVKEKIGILTRHNLLPNVMNNLPGLQHWSFGATGAAVPGLTYDTSTYPGETVIKVPCPNNATGYTYAQVIVKVDKRFVGKRFHFSICAARETGFTATARVYNPSYGGLSTSLTIGETMSVGNSSFNLTDVDYVVAALFINNTSGADKNVYIKNMVLTDSVVHQIEPSPIDYMTGFSGRASATTTGTTVSLTGYKSFMYDVLVTPYFNGTAYVTKAHDQFTITSSVNGTVFYQIVPLCGFMV